MDTHYIVIKYSVYKKGKGMFKNNNIHYFQHKNNNTPYTINKIAIIGGGVSGVATFIELVKLAIGKKVQQNISITIFNPSEIGPGTPYRDKNRYVLNIGMMDMGG